MQTVKITSTILVSLVLLMSCGNKGPLYLPNESPDSKPAVEVEPETDEEDLDNLDSSGKNNASAN